MRPTATLAAALLTGLAVLPAITATGSAPITARNWQRHPAIVEIKAIYQEIERAKAAGRLRTETRSLGYCRPGHDTERTLYLDANGAVRSYQVGGGSEDSAIRIDLYYDRKGALRFVLATAGAVNDSHYEYRIYLSRAGKRLWQERRLLKGPGYPFPAELPDAWLQRNPRQAFASADPCESP